MAAVARALWLPLSLPCVILAALYFNLTRSTSFPTFLIIFTSFIIFDFIFSVVYLFDCCEFSFFIPASPSRLTLGLLRARVCVCVCELPDKS